MESIINQRVKHICSYKSKSLRNFASMVGINNNTLIQQLNGDRAISLSTISAILLTFDDISAEWLLRGKGEMIKKESEASTYNESVLQAKIEELTEENAILRDLHVKDSIEIAKLEKQLNKKIA